MLNSLLAAAPSPTSGLMTQVFILAAMFAIMYFLLIRPQKKKDKEMQAMRSTLEVGDEIMTIGGIIGVVVNLKDDTVVLETGSDRSKIRIARWAIQSNMTSKELQSK